MDIIVLLLLLCTVLFLLDYWIKPRHRVVLPYRIPVIGHLWFFIYYGKDTVKALSLWAETCGPMYTIQLFHKHVVIVNGYDEIFEVLVSKGKETGGRPQTFRYTLFMGEKEIGFADYSPQWKKRKNFVLSLMKLHGEGLGKLQSTAVEICYDFINTLQDKIAAEFDPYDDLHLAICNSIASFIAGSKFSAESKDFPLWLQVGNNVPKYLGIFSAGFELDLFPFLRHFGNKVYIAGLEHRKSLMTIYRRLEKSKSNGLLLKDCVASAIMNEVENEDRKSCIDDPECASQLFADFLSAGIETSTKSLYCFLQIMADKQKIQQQIYDEIESTLKKYNAARVTLEHRAEMPYSRAVIFELMRYSSIAPLSLPHKALSPVEIAGETYSKDTYIFTNLWHLHHDSKLWDSPWEFHPERFLDENGEVVPADHENRKHLLAFGAGARVCLGQTFALARMFIFITNIIKELKIEDTGINHDPLEYQHELLIAPERKTLKFIPRVMTD